MGSAGHPPRPVVTVALSVLRAWVGVCAGVVHDHLRGAGLEHGCGVCIRARNGRAMPDVCNGGEEAGERGQDEYDEIGGVESV
jgi:hypothetical protein